MWIARKSENFKHGVEKGQLGQDRHRPKIAEIIAALHTRRILSDWTDFIRRGGTLFSTMEEAFYSFNWTRAE